MPRASLGINEQRSTDLPLVHGCHGSRSTGNPVDHRPPQATKFDGEDTSAILVNRRSFPATPSAQTTRLTAVSVRNRERESLFRRILWRNLGRRIPGTRCTDQDLCGSSWTGIFVGISGEDGGGGDGRVTRSTEGSPGRRRFKGGLGWAFRGVSFGGFRDFLEAIPWPVSFPSPPLTAISIFSSSPPFPISTSTVISTTAGHTPLFLRSDHCHLAISSPIRPLPRPILSTISLFFIYTASLHLLPVCNLLCRPFPGRFHLHCHRPLLNHPQCQLPLFQIH